MAYLSILIGVYILCVVLWDTFETIVLPRTVTRRLRLTRLFYYSLWRVWLGILRLTCGPERREILISAFGPMSLLLLIVVWAVGLIAGFGLIHWGLGSHVHADHLHPGFLTDLYMSGTTFFTLGFGDVTPATPFTRFLAVLEAGMGFGFLAVVIGYLPVLYQSFSRRESQIVLLDARAGSPPTAGELLRRYGQATDMEDLEALLADWEKWAADLLESHLSFPVLCYYRSQHDGQSWLGALTAILDACALIRCGFEEEAPWQRGLQWQAQLTYAMARHAVVDLALILLTEPLECENCAERLPPADKAKLHALMDSTGLALCKDVLADAQLAEVRRQYEPYVLALADRLKVSLPAWIPEKDAVDNWQTSAWDHTDHFSANSDV